mmetsp:Transcript_29354/g.44257  ORF Transcript_29354/g.44257 Transcript_29354/m.44257 type:complete len:82 (-) Transcript_29354:1345-1590(-)
MLNSMVQQQAISQTNQQLPKSAKKGGDNSTKKSLAGSGSHQKEHMILTPNNGKKPMSLETSLPLDEERYLSQPKSGGSIGL